MAPFDDPNEEETEIRLAVPVIVVTPILLTVTFPVAEETCIPFPAVSDVTIPVKLSPEP